MHGMQLIKELQAQFANVLGVLLVIFQAACKTARSQEQLARRAVVAVWLLARKSFMRDFLQKPLADANARHGQKAKIQVTSQSDERDGRDAHDVGAIPPNSVSFHTLANVPLQNGRQSLLEEGQFNRLQAVGSLP